MSRQFIVAGNWKMNKNLGEGKALAQAIADNVGSSETLVILAPPYVSLETVGSTIGKVDNIKLAAQNCHQSASGAFTGEISTAMLKSVGVEYVIIGHSERREYFNESNELLAEKTNTVLKNGLIPIFCCGEPLSVREAGTHVEYVKKQLEEGLFHLSEIDFSKIVIAYEPIWAIGTGVTASPQQAQEMHAAIRHLISDQYNELAADATSILYGGSVKPANAEDIFGQVDVDGALVGGASLDAAGFAAIIAASTVAVS